MLQPIPVKAEATIPAAPATHSPIFRAQVAEVPAVQRGPAYFCWDCGRPVLDLIPWFVHPTNSCLLDTKAAHIWYLQRLCGCKGRDRVARLGDCITLLEFPEPKDFSDHHAFQVAELEALEAALDLIARNVPDEAERHADPVAKVAYKAYLRLVSVDDAIREMHALMAAAQAAAALSAGKPGETPAPARATS